MLKIAELRAERKMTQQQLAEVVGVKNYTIANWEQGRTEPGIGDLIALADYFKCSIDYIVGREDDFGNFFVENLSPSERGLLNIFSRLPYEKKKILSEIAEDMANASSCRQ